MTTVVALQSNYIPWKGYFDLVNDSDIFIFYDDLQFTKNDWRNRNKIMTPNGASWITIPVGIDTHRLICEVEIKDQSWQGKHWKTLQQFYGKSPFFSAYKAFFEEIYLGQRWTNLSALNQSLIRSISNELLKIDTVFDDSRNYCLSGQKLERLLELVSKSGATRYVSGPAAKEYIDHSRFADANVELVWKDYSGYPEYRQQSSQFEHGVSVLDLIFNVGPDAPWYIWGWRDGRKGPG